MHDYEEPKEKSAHSVLEECLPDDGDIKERQYNIGQYCMAMGYGALQYWPMTATATELGYVIQPIGNRQYRFKKERIKGVE